MSNTEPIRLTFRRQDGAEVHATIEADGSVSLLVRNAPGLSCRALTAGLEAACGDVRARRYDPRILAAAQAGTLSEADAMALDRDMLRNRVGGGPCG